VNEAEKVFRDYVAAIPRFDGWQAAECSGYFGYGNGRAAPAVNVIVQQTGKSMDTPCDSCPAKSICWEKTKDKAAEILPESTRRFMRLAAVLKGPGLIKAWVKEGARPGDPPNTYRPDPYTAMMLVNMQRAIVHELED
jgi:hypothetical protein